MKIRDLDAGEPTSPQLQEELNDIKLKGIRAFQFAEFAANLLGVEFRCVLPLFAAFLCVSPHHDTFNFDIM